MKRKLLIPTLVFLGLFGALKAQSIKVFTHDKKSVTNDTLVVNINDPSMATETDLLVVNTSSAAKTIRVHRSIKTIPGTYSTWFCWDVCFGPIVDRSGTVSIAAGDTNKNMHLFLAPSDNLGTALVRYSIYDGSDSSFIYARYNVTSTTGISRINGPAATISNIYPSPANTYAVLKYNISNGKQASLNIYNALGALAYKTTLDEKQTEFAIPTLLLTDGMYFCTVQIDGKAIGTKKLIVNHN